MPLTKPKTKKSPSQRLKAVYFKLWEQDPEGFEAFELFYESKMEKLINYFKKMINEKK